MKAILVLDEMPTFCLLCPLFELESGVCRVTGEDNLLTDTSRRRLKGCPLKEMPDRKRLPHETDENDILFGKACGWNDCLEEIER